MATKRFPLFLSSFYAILLNIVFSCQGQFPVPEKHAPLFVFGDSIFDYGNNNYINTIFQANYFPYGESFFKYPTGRFSDGRIIPDFIADYAKLPLIPPYLQPGNHEFSCGVNFASAGAGALAETNQGMELRKKLGDRKAKDLLSRAVYLFSIGSNDYIFSFKRNSIVLQSYSRQEYVGLVTGNITLVIREIYSVGGRKLGFLKLGVLACAPNLRAIDAKNHGACFGQITPYVKLHNKEISDLLPWLQNELSFKKGKVACCGSGPYRGILSCGGKRDVAEYYLRHNPSEYVFFDSGHLTERAYQQFSEQAWNGKPGFAKPYSLKALFAFN